MCFGPVPTYQVCREAFAALGQAWKGGAFAALGPKVVRKCFRSINCTFAGLVLKPGPLSRNIPPGFRDCRALRERASAHPHVSRLSDRVLAGPRSESDVSLVGPQRATNMRERHACVLVSRLWRRVSHQTSVPGGLSSFLVLDTPCRQAERAAGA